jgi:hypothetical protein
MQALENEGLIIRNRLRFIELRGDDESLESVQICGPIECISGIMVIVNKWLSTRRGTNNRPEVKGCSYSYHAYIHTQDNRPPIIRYDSAHWQGQLHRHTFDPLSGRETIDDITLEELPSLGDFIRQAVSLRRQFTNP